MSTYSPFNRIYTISHTIPQGAFNNYIVFTASKKCLVYTQYTGGNLLFPSPNETDGFLVDNEYINFLTGSDANSLRASGSAIMQAGQQLRSTWSSNASSGRANFLITIIEID